MKRTLTVLNSIFYQNHNLRNFYSLIRIFHLSLFLLAVSQLIEVKFEITLVLFSLFFCVVSQVLIVNAVGHRMIGHETFSLTNLKQFYLLLWHAYLGLMSPLVSSLIHRKHHTYADTDKDPHSPPSKLVDLFLFECSLFFNRLNVFGFHYREVAKQGRRKFFLFYHYNSPLISLLFSILLFTIGGLNLLFYLQCLPVLYCAIAQINLVVPTHPHSNQATNRRKSQDSVLANILTLGEGAHEAHHKNPKLVYYKNSNPLLFDFTGYIISNLLSQEKSK